MSLTHSIVASICLAFAAACLPSCLPACTFVRYRFAFIAYVIVLQLFLVYVRVQAKAANDRTPIQLSNPLSGLLAQQMGGDGGGGMMKSLASSFLASSSTAFISQRRKPAMFTVQKVHRVLDGAERDRIRHS